MSQDLTFQQLESIHTTNELAAKIFDNSRDLIDYKLGHGYAMKNPNLLASTITMQEHLYTSLTTIQN